MADEVEDYGLVQVRATFMSNAGPADLSNPYLPPKADLTAAWAEGRPSFLNYRRACLGHETFQRCVGLADLICAWLGTPIVAGRAWALISMLRSGFAVSRLEMIEWVVGSFVFLPALIWLMLELGISLPRRRPWAWRMQILLSGSVLLCMVVRWTLFRPHGVPAWGAISALCIVIVQGAILGVFLSKPGQRIIAAKYAVIVAATPSMTRSLGCWPILGAIILSVPIGFGPLTMGIWLSGQAASILEPLWGP
jgi:hypothetical protein